MNDLRGPRARKCLSINDLSILYFHLASELKFNYIIIMDKKQRGRKKGSVSFMQVELNELNRVLKPDAKVILSIRYAQLVGLNGKPVSSNLDVLGHCVASGKAEMELVDFGDDEEQDIPAPNANKKKEEIKDDDHISTQAELETFDENPF